MPTITAFECPFQSQGGFRNNNSAIYREAALIAAGNTRTGRGETIVEVERRLAGYEYNEIGDVFSIAMTDTTMGTGGTSFVHRDEEDFNGVIDPTAGPGDDTPLTGNSDVRLINGEDYANNIDTQIAALNATTDIWMQFQYFQAHDVQVETAWDFVTVARAHTLWWNLMAAKYEATGKPYFLGCVLPGHTTGGDAWTMTIMHEVVMHLAVNGRRSTNPLLAAYPVIDNFYVLGVATGSVAFDDATEADNLVPPGTPDRIHPSQASGMRVARQMAVQIAKLVQPSVTQEYDGYPYIVNAFVKSAAAADTIRCRVKITPGNRLVWTPRPAEDEALYNLNAGAKGPPAGGGHIYVSTHKVYQPTQTYQRWRPPTILITEIIVDNAQTAMGYAWLDLKLAQLPTLGTCISIQPEAAYRYYWRRTEAIATTEKLMPGLREEAGATPYAVDAACSDLLIAGRTWMPVLPVTSLPVLASDPGA